MASMGVKGGIASMQQTSAANAIPQAPTVLSTGTVAGFSLDFTKPSTWVAAIYVGSVAYLLGAYIMLGRYRVPL